MTKETKYGFISDVHQDARIVEPMVRKLSDRGVDSIILNGDIGHFGGDLKGSIKYMAHIINTSARSGKEIYVLPGSHEPIILYDQVMDYFCDKFSNVVDAKNIPHLDKGGHRLVFIPGSDFLCGGEYVIGNLISVKGKNLPLPTGRYIISDKTRIPIPHRIEDWKGHLEEMGEENGGFYNKNIYDLRKSVSDPDRTIVICHVPRKFDNLDSCVDMAEFGHVDEGFILDGQEVEKGSIFPITPARKLSSLGAPVSIRKENRGNEDLRVLYDEIGINKAVNGHFHESSHRANDRQGNHVEEGKEICELFWNSGCADFGHFGILTVRDNKVKYENLIV